MQVNTYKWAIGAMLVLLIGVPCLAADGIVYVDARAAGANDGTSWENAYGYLQDALAAAESFDASLEIRVARGTYRPDNGAGILPGDRHAAFDLRGGVILMGGYAGLGAADPDARDVETWRTVLSGDLAGNDIPLNDLQWQTLFDYATDATLGDNSIAVVTAMDSADETAVLDGFTITAGYANVNSHASPSYRRDGGGGGGLCCAEGSPVIRDCTFRRNTAYCTAVEICRGGGMANFAGSPTLMGCTFEENISFGQGLSGFGGAVYNDQGGDGTFTDCLFRANVAAGWNSLGRGGAIHSVGRSCTLTECRFLDNRAIEGGGGALYVDDGGAILTDCTFSRNEAAEGGAIVYGTTSHGTADHCVFTRNLTTNFGPGGAIRHCASYHDVELSRCLFAGNSAQGNGGALSCSGASARRGGESFGICVVGNCVFSGNSAEMGGAVHHAQSHTVALTNCTLAANHASTGSAVYSSDGDMAMRNCIVWLSGPRSLFVAGGELTVAYCDIEGGWPGLGNNDADPEFVNPAGSDGALGTEDDNYRLSFGSPCIEAGDSMAVPPEMLTDLAGEGRIVGADVDMGAYEYGGPFDYYVDAVNGSDSNGGTSPRRPFATIEQGIDSALDGAMVFVRPGTYHEEIDFQGKAITVTGEGGAPTLEAPGAYGVSFYSAEASDSVLRNFVISGCDVGVFISGSSPTIHNITAVHNKFGIAAYSGARPNISNCIFWDNEDGDLFECTARSSCLRDAAEGEGNISHNPLFANMYAGDYHLLSARGRYVPAYKLWTFDPVTSPCVDAGDPTTTVGAEQAPNGGRINMGAYGGTPEASMTERFLSADINNDGIVDLRDLTILTEQWLEEVTAPEPPVLSAPQPDPAQWAQGGLPTAVEGDVGPLFKYWVEMRAVEAVAWMGPVQYYFQAGDGQTGRGRDEFSSGWIDEPVWKVEVGPVRPAIEFRVRARDMYGNTTEWSDWARGSTSMRR